MALVVPLQGAHRLVIPITAEDEELVPVVLQHFRRQHLVDPQGLALPDEAHRLVVIDTRLPWVWACRQAHTLLGQGMEELPQVRTAIELHMDVRCLRPSLAPKRLWIDQCPMRIGRREKHPNEAGAKQQGPAGTTTISGTRTWLQKPQKLVQQHSHLAWNGLLAQPPL